MLRSFNIRRIVNCSHYSFISSSSSTLNANLANDVAIGDKKLKEKSNLSGTERTKLVAAAFASLKDLSNVSTSKGSLKEEINAATDLNSLLSLAEKPYLPRSSALMIITALANWANEGKIKLADFELDVRFAKLCRILGRSHSGGKNEDMADLSVVLGVTADDQAAKLISSISLSQMIKILKTLAAKKRRSTPLLRSLAYNISSTSETLNVKESSDVFYGLAQLNYPDDVLLEKIQQDFRENLPRNQNPAVVCSVIKSVGLMRYRDTELIDELSEWIVKHSLSMNSKELLPLLFTFASVNYMPGNFPEFYEILKPHLNENEMVDVSKWVDVAWSLVVLQQYDEKIIDSVLSSAFIDKLSAKCGSVEEIDVLTKIRLLQINSVVKLENTYRGHLLNEKSFLTVPVLQSKEKHVLINSVKDTLSSVVTNPESLQINVDSNMGFFIDTACCVDQKGNFVKIDSDLPGQDLKKIALMTCDYHDFCRGCHHEFTGLTALKHRLVSGIGYCVVLIPYTEYNPRDVLVNRVRYIHEKIKEVIVDT